MGIQGGFGMPELIIIIIMMIICAVPTLVNISIGILLAVLFTRNKNKR